MEGFYRSQIFSLREESSKWVEDDYVSTLLSPGRVLLINGRPDRSQWTSCLCAAVQQAVTDRIVMIVMEVVQSRISAACCSLIWRSCCRENTLCLLFMGFFPLAASYLGLWYVETSLQRFIYQDNLFIYIFSHLLSSGGGSSQRHDLQLPHELHQPDRGPGPQLRLPSLHALFPAGLHPAGFHPQPEVPGSLLSGGEPGHDSQSGSHLHLLNLGNRHICIISLIEAQLSFMSASSH